MNRLHRFLALSLILSSLPSLHAEPTRGICVVKNDRGEQVCLYKESHALLIGISDYTAGWADLPGVGTDIPRVRAALADRGFNIVTVMDPTKAELERAVDSFISKFGREAENRIVVYFSGHGYTLKKRWGGDMGYIVPADAPDPNTDRDAFTDTAIDMVTVEGWAKDIDSKHALFLFDSCFSGSLFSLSKAAPAIISYKTSMPVRQFITAGSEDETVPDKSIFCQQFLDALEGEADGNGDGYLTGSELGEYLQSTVVNYSYDAQHPQYGKIRDRRLDKGDFVLALAPRPAVEDNAVEGTVHAGGPEATPDEVEGTLQRAIALYTGLAGRTDEQAAHALFAAAAESGYPPAVMWVARLINMGQCGFAADPAQAELMAAAVIDRVRRLAREGNNDAAFLMGSAHRQGLGVTKDTAEEIAWWHKAAEGGNALAMYNIGVEAYTGEGVAQDLHQSVAWFRRSAERGLPVAMHLLGVAYDTGEGVDTDDSEAATWYRKAADAGVPEAAYLLGAMYDDGEGVARDDREAAGLYREAADAGIPEAMHDLAVLYDHGEGVAQDDREAMSWYRRAAEAGVPESMMNIGVMYYTAQGVPQDNREAAKWFRMAADAGLAQAMYKLGLMYEDGVGVEQDDSEAVKWFGKAAELGDENARRELLRRSGAL